MCLICSCGRDNEEKITLSTGTHSLSGLCQPLLHSLITIHLHFKPLYSILKPFVTNMFLRKVGNGEAMKGPDLKETVKNSTEYRIPPVWVLWRDHSHLSFETTRSRKDQNVRMLPDASPDIMLLTIMLLPPFATFYFGKFFAALHHNPPLVLESTLSPCLCRAR